MPKKDKISADQLRKILGYDPQTGVLTRLPLPGGGRRNKFGEAGSVGPNGYRIIPINGASYLAHQLAWLYVTGEWPSRWLKHKNGIKADNRIDNLMLRPETAVDGTSKLGLTQERLKELFDYNPKTGDFVWKVSVNKGKKGNTAGVIGYYGYRYMSVDGHKYVAHRLAWFCVHGVWPADKIDHINGVRNDNRIENLREATNAQNGHNRGRTSLNKSGYKGVSLHKKSGKFEARITLNYRIYLLGKFDTAKEAHEAYCAAAKKYHGEFAHTG